MRRCPMSGGMIAEMLSLLIAQAGPALPVCGPTAFVTYREGAPVDRIAVENLSQDDWSITSVEIALAGSAGSLVFDTLPGGQGLNSAQPFRSGPRSGQAEARLAAIPDLGDGDEQLTLEFEVFPPAARFWFSTDLDVMAIGRGSTILDPSDIAGATVSVTFEHARGGEETHIAAFDTRATARPAAPCLS